MASFSLLMQSMLGSIAGLKLFTVSCSVSIACGSIVQAFSWGFMWDFVISISAILAWWIILARLYSHPRRTALLIAFLLLIIGIAFRAWDEPRSALYPYDLLAGSSFGLSVPSPEDFRNVRFLEPPTIELHRLSRTSHSSYR